MEKYREYILEHLDEEHILQQLAEECAELSKASLKVIRAMPESKNKTPIAYWHAKVNLDEEIRDVLNVLYIHLGPDWLEVMAKGTPKNPKIKRWAERLGYEEDMRTENG